MLKEHFGPKNKWLLIHPENNTFQKIFWKFKLKRISMADCRRNER